MIYASKITLKMESKCEILSSKLFYSQETEIKVFPVDEKDSLQDCLNLARLLKSKKQFTDVAGF